MMSKAVTIGAGSISKRAMKRRMWAYIFILPQLIMFAVFTLYPIMMSYIYSLYDWSGIGPMNKFVGLQNLKEVAQDPLFWNAFKNSFLYMIGTVGIMLPTALVMAIILNNAKMKGRTFYRTLYFLPVVTTTAVVGAVMRNVFANHNGLVNGMLMKFGLIGDPIRWLENGDLAMWALIFVGSWKLFGMKMVYWLAGLQSIPNELYEAVKIDGANEWQAFRHVTIPLLMPIGAVILLLSVVNSLHVFDLVKVMTEGGPGFETEVVDLYIYRYAFSGTSAGMPEVGYASAAGIFFGMVIFVISITLGWIVKRSNDRRA
ncbi:carbohydrate ABC transporter permease [Paenibacillus chungangensis]|uniref:Carbohydrate ABC transporter permease n=1 Tax=Paenibacillus chungangensis TaxID=696535 RepID=A0ABW3HSS1_9BACL